MFLLNSRAPLVTTACHPGVVSPKAAGIPSPEVTGPVCRFPSPGLRRQALGCSPRAPVSVLGTVTGDPSQPPFQGLPASTETPYTGVPSCLQPLLSITELRGLRQLDGATAPLGLAGSVRGWACVTASVPPWRRNINRLPFRWRPIRCHLRTG